MNGRAKISIQTSRLNLFRQRKKEEGGKEEGKEEGRKKGGEKEDPKLVIYTKLN